MSRAFVSADQRRCCGLAARRLATTSRTWELLSSVIGADIEIDTVRSPAPQCHNLSFYHLTSRQMGSASRLRPVRRSCCSDMHRDAAAPAPNSSYKASADGSCNARAMMVMIGSPNIKRPEGPWMFVHCRSHLRRRFVTQARNTKSPIAEPRFGRSPRSMRLRRQCSA